MLPEKADKHLKQQVNGTTTESTTAPSQGAPSAEKTNGSRPSFRARRRFARSRKPRGPPADGIPSKTKVMVANLPYDLSEEKVCDKSSPRH